MTEGTKVALTIMTMWWMMFAMWWIMAATFASKKQAFTARIRALKKLADEVAEERLEELEVRYRAERNGECQVMSECRYDIRVAAILRGQIVNSYPDWYDDDTNSPTPQKAA